MKKIVKRITSYQCSVCKTEHENSKECKKCENNPIEKRKFKNGDKVKNIEPRICSNIKCRNKPCIFKGRVVKIIGPNPSDYEYEVKWLGGKSERLKSHVFEYEVEYKCPRCKEKKGARYYAPELKKLK